MAFKMKYGKSSFPFKTSAYKQSGGYGGRPGERAEETKGGARADQKLRDVRERREELGGGKVAVKLPRFMGKPTQGYAEGDEYQMGLADYKIFGGAGRKALRDAGKSVITPSGKSDYEKYMKKKRKKRDRLKRKGKLDSHGNLKKNLDAYGNVVK